MKKTIAFLLLASFMLAAVCGVFAETAYDTPSGYNAHDYGKLRDFFELTSLQGVPNGKIMDPDYDPNDPATWSGVVWTDDSVKRVKIVSLYMYGFAGVLDLSDCAALETLDCSYSSMDGVNVENCAKLKVLLCGVNKRLEQLELNGCTMLETLDCGGAALGALDITSLPRIKDLNCCDCELSTLTLGTANNLDKLDCAGNALTELDTSGCSALRELNCDANKLTLLDVRKNKKLKTLFCSENELTELKVYKSSTLKGIICMYNKLKRIDLSGCVFNVQKLEATGNGYVGCDLAETYPQANMVYAYAAAGASFVKWVDKNGDHLYSNPGVPYSDQESYMCAVFENTAIPGDMNGNGVLETADALVILRYALQIEELSPELEELCDADGNGIINTVDALTVLRAALGLS